MQPKPAAVTACSKARVATRSSKCWERVAPARARRDEHATSLLQCLPTPRTQDRPRRKARRRASSVPYHAWCYDLQGRLRSAPGTKGVQGFEKDKVRLAPVCVEEFLGFVFVNFDRHAATMEQTYPKLAETIESLCPDIAARRFAFEHSAEEESNWLVAVENYSACTQSLL